MTSAAEPGPPGPASASNVDDVGLAQQADDQVEVAVHHVQRQRVQGEVVAVPQQRGAALDLQHLQRPVPLIGHRLAQMLAGGAEPGEHVHERPAAGRLLGGHNTVSVLHRGGQRQLDEHVPAGLHGRRRDLGVQPGRQADVHQIHRGVGDQAVQVGGGGKAELAADRRQLLWGAAEDDHFVHIGPLGVDGGVGLAETGAQQCDLHGGQLPPRHPRPASDRDRPCNRSGALPPTLRSW
jgi:hypothetical protein